MSETLLTPSKKIYDAVHGFIRFNGIERALIDTPAFQRLHHIHQLGISYLVYPGATHSRFEHSLGTMQVASAIFDHLLNKQMELEDPLYWRQIVRLAALCHDLGHLPFSHDAEEEILGKEGHELWTLRLILSAHLQSVWELMENVYPGKAIAQDVAHIALGEAKLRALGIDAAFTAQKKRLSEIITGDFFGADRIDYLLRDARCTGVSHGVFDYQQLIEMLCILPSGIGIEGGGIESCEALLLSRHFMYKRVYNYASVWGYKFHVRRFMRRFYEVGNFLHSLESFLSVTDNEVLAAMRARIYDPDACALFKREWRFTPLSIDASITEEKIKEAQRTIGIEEEALFWHLSKKKGEGRIVSFPVLLSSGTIVDASEVAQVRIPQNKKSWLFVAPTVGKGTKDALERMLHASSL
jgi:hypothetical protein